MPRGYPNPKPTPARDPAPMILIEPAGDAIRFNAYGLDAGQMIDLLRRSLLHLVATQSGLHVVSIEVPPAAAIVLDKPAKATTKARATKKPSTNGRPAMRSEMADASVQRYSLADLDLDSDEDGD